ncbi:MAG TPA: triose-phosphate isomerase [Candidatus Dormibacteraeota bacterium]|nr:triose-phosphate isomerase [Candidatus Dormibacteraeota bacterium]
MKDRSPLFVGNWKMNKNAAQTHAFFAAFLPLAERIPSKTQIAIAPPFTALASAAGALHDSTRVALAAQTMSERSDGAFTGEISASMLAEFSVKYVILGHSERRTYQHESYIVIAAKLRAALDAGFTPILAVGESLDLREDGQAISHVLAQVHAAIHGLTDAQIARIAVAYEPIWAIGSGLNCDPGEAESVASKIRGAHRALEQSSILYGGSMKPENAAGYLAMPDIDGGLVGGASLDPTAFAQLLEGASRA